jgi:hypothetical protein
MLHGYPDARLTSPAGNNLTTSTMEDNRLRCTIFKKNFVYLEAIVYFVFDAGSVYKKL